MFDATDILCGIAILGLFAYILIDSYILGKKQEKRHKEINEQRIKEGKKPIDWDAPSGYSGGSGFDAEGFRNFIYRNMGNMG